MSIDRPAGSPYLAPDDPAAAIARSADGSAYAGWTREQLDAALDELRPGGRERGLQAMAKRNPADAWEALQHAMARMLGHPVADEHPGVAQLHDLGYDELIAAAGTVRGRRELDVRAALSSGDAPDLLGEVAATIAEGVWSSYEPSFAFARTYRLPGYREAAVGIAELGPFVRPQENGQFVQPEFDLSASSLQVLRYVMRIPVSLEALASTPSLVTQLIEQPLAAGVRQMRAAMFAAIVASSDLAAQTSTSLNTAGFDAAANKLASIALPGGALLDLPPAHMLVSSAQLGTALALVEALGRPVQVHSTPALSTGTWILLADPAAVPCVGFAVPLSGNPLEVEAPTPAKDVDAMYWKASLNFGVSVVSGFGVKVTS
jgi:hypothetical protein